MSVIGYPQLGKRKSEEILVNFVAGIPGGYIRREPRLVMGAAAAFYGTVGLEDLFRQARDRAARGAGDYYYLDNAYFDVARGRYFRISRNALQAPGDTPAFDRLNELGLGVKPWRQGGSYVLLVEQSDYFMRELAGWAGGLSSWHCEMIEKIRTYTDRPIRIRAWPSDKIKASRSLPEDLEGAWAVVTHSSAAANEALLAGVPVFCSGQCPALELGSGDIASLEEPRRPDGRQQWAARLAGSQWRLDEMRAGVAWRALQSQLAEAGQ